MLNLIDEFTRECLTIRVSRKLNSTDVIDVLSDQFILRGVPSHIRSDNGPEFIATAVRNWIAAVGARTAYIEPGSPWENGYCESFNSKLREAAGWRDLLQPRRGKDRHRELAPPLQYKAPAFIPGLPTASSAVPAVTGFATRNRFAGPGHSTVAAKPSCTKIGNGPPRWGRTVRKAGGHLYVASP